MYDTTHLDKFKTKKEILRVFTNLPESFTGARLVTIGGRYDVDTVHGKDIIVPILGVGKLRYRFAENGRGEINYKTYQESENVLLDPSRLTVSIADRLRHYFSRDEPLPCARAHPSTVHFCTISGFLPSYIKSYSLGDDLTVLGPKLVNKVFDYDNRLLKLFKDIEKDLEGYTAEILLTREQLELNLPAMLEAGFKEDFSFVNPNTGNRVYHFIKPGG